MKMSAWAWPGAPIAMVTASAPFLPRILLDLLRMNVAPLAIFQMLRSMCAGQRLATEGAPEPVRG